MSAPIARDPVPPEPGDCQYRDALLVANKRRHYAEGRIGALEQALRSIPHICGTHAHLPCGGCYAARALETTP